MRFREAPSMMEQPRFMEVFGGIYEHSPWVAEAVWRAGLTQAHDNVDALHTTMKAVVDGAGNEQILNLIRAHPDLAGRAAIAGELTAASSHEQASAGLDRLTASEYDAFARLNTAYRGRFGFPFIIAARTQSKDTILAAFRDRLDNDAQSEVAIALDNIHRIARFRLEDLAEDSA